MKLFGKKDKPEKSAETFEGLDDLENTGGASLSAPPRDLGGRGGGGRKALAIVLLLLLVICGLGGGFYYMTMMGDTAVPVPQAAAPAAPVESDIDQIPETAFADMPPQPEPVVTEEAAQLADPFAPMPETAPGQLPMDMLGSPPQDSAEAVPAEALLPGTTADMTAEMPPDAAVADMPVPPVPAPASMPVAAAPDAASMEPPEDMPLPAEMMALPTPAAPPATAPAPAAAEAPAPAPVPATATQPTAAEMAIVQNAAVLDQLSAPAATPAPAAPAEGNTTEQIGQDAIVRDLPSSYLTVTKNQDGSALDSRLTAARTALAQNRNAAALQMFEELYRDYPKDSRVMMGRALSLQKLNQVDGALAAYEAILDVNPSNLDALTNMLGLLKQRNPALALEKLQELRDAYPYDASVTAQLGVAYGAAGSYAEAMKYLDMADALRPGSAYVIYNKAVLLDKMGSSAKAAVLYRQIVRMASEGQLDEPLPVEAIQRRLSTIR